MISLQSQQTCKVNTMDNKNNNINPLIERFKQNAPLLVKMYPLKHMQPESFLQLNEEDTQKRRKNFRDGVGVSNFSGSIIRQDINNRLHNRQGIIFNDNVEIMHSFKKDGAVNNENMSHIHDENNKLHAIQNISEIKDVLLRDKVIKSNLIKREDNQAIYNATIKSLKKHSPSTVCFKYTEQLFLPKNGFKDSIAGVLVEVLLPLNETFDSTYQLMQHLRKNNNVAIDKLQEFAQKLNVPLYIKYPHTNYTTGLIEYQQINKLADLNNPSKYFNFDNEFTYLV